MNDIYVIYVVSFLVFIAVLALVEGGYLLWRGLHEEGTIKINKRLKMLSAGGKHGKEVLDILRRNKMSEIPVISNTTHACAGQGVGTVRCRLECFAISWAVACHLWNYFRGVYLLYEVSLSDWLDVRFWSGYCHSVHDYS